MPTIDNVSTTPATKAHYDTFGLAASDHAFEPVKPISVTVDSCEALRRPSDIIRPQATLAGLAAPGCYGVAWNRSPLDTRPQQQISAAIRTGLPRVAGLVTLTERELDGGWRIDARAGRSTTSNVRGLLAGVRYAPSSSFEVVPMEIRVGRQSNTRGNVSIGARTSLVF